MILDLYSAHHWYFGEFQVHGRSYSESLWVCSVLWVYSKCWNIEFYSGPFISRLIYRNWEKLPADSSESSLLKKST